MNDIAYDISHLLETELQQVEVPASRIVRAANEASAKPAKPSVAEAQEALARELMRAATIHEALIQQYLRMSGDTFRETYGQ